MNLNWAKVYRARQKGALNRGKGGCRGQKKAENIIIIKYKVLTYNNRNIQKEGEGEGEAEGVKINL